MADALEVTINSTDQKFGYTAVLRSHTPIPIDYVPPFGDGNGYTPLELLLISLGACSSATIGFLLRKMGKNISAIQARANGVRREQHPTSFQKIHLDFTINSIDAKDADVQKTIKLAEESICPVWQMVKGNVEVKTEYTIVAS